MKIFLKWVFFKFFRFMLFFINFGQKSLFLKEFSMNRFVFDVEMSKPRARVIIKP